MKAIKLLFVMVAVMAVTFTSCKKETTTPKVENTLALCSDAKDNDGDGKKDCDDPDCAAFAKCQTPTATCNDNIKNGDETGVDCGGSCKACEATPTCEDGIKNGNETGVDCGGSCKACPTTATLMGDINEDKTLDPSLVYILDGLVRVNEGATLTVPAGTIFKANFGGGSDASALIIARGGKIMAKGTAEKPIIFTSIADQIQPGQLNSTLTPAAVGQWGGVIVLGKAPISAKKGDTEAQIEGVDADKAFGKYGGSDAADNSGTLEYVSIRFTGTKIGDASEIQGLTLGGVGSGTTIKNIEIVSSDDDGVEFFGGTVNVTNLLVAHQNDDAIDLDQNYAGTVKNAVVFNYNTKDSNSGFEFDGPENSTHTSGMYMIENATVYQKGTSWAGNFKSKSQGTIKNCKFVGFKDEDAFQFASKELTIDGGAFSFAKPSYDMEAFSLTETNSPKFGAEMFDGVGADETVFAWTWAYKTLELNK